MRIALSVEYIGKKYFGWQQQNHTSKNTIQYFVDHALSKIADHKIKSICSGRTDTGVNALNQIIHFDTESKRSEKNWIDGVNSNLPNDIRVKRLYKVDNDFHARFLAKERTYKYFINVNSESTIFNNSYTWVIRDKLSLPYMKLSLKYLEGIHDFSSFRSSGCQASSPIRNISSVSLEKNNNIIVFSITANAFLYHMVRNIVGTIVDIGIKKIKPKDLKVIMNKKNRNYCSKMAPAHALFLWNVSYPKKYKIKYNTESILM
tara:strand:+ start:135 stop:917 length:783 start_codon:yes stop_codon:yes gene_type:complete